jgi:hypothetical protein
MGTGLAGVDVLGPPVLLDPGRKNNTGKCENKCNEGHMNCCKPLLILLFPWDSMNIRGKINSACSSPSKVTLNVGFHFSVAKK